MYISKERTVFSAGLRSILQLSTLVSHLLYPLAVPTLSFILSLNPIQLPLLIFVLYTACLPVNWSALLGTLLRSIKLVIPDLQQRVFEGHLFAFSVCLLTEYLTVVLSIFLPEYILIFCAIYFVCSLQLESHNSLTCTACQSIGIHCFASSPFPHCALFDFLFAAFVYSFLPK